MAAKGQYDGDTYMKMAGHGGVALAEHNPDDMEGFIEIGLKVLDLVADKKIPKAMFKNCAGIVLLSAEEGGLFISSQGGSGVALFHNTTDGKWSNPLAVNHISVGAGLVFGYAHKELVAFLNHFAMKKLLEGDGSLDIGVDAGFAVGQYGRSATGKVAVSEKGGLGSCFVYTFQKGAMVSVEAVLGSRLTPPTKPHQLFYGTENHADILDGKVQPPEGSKVPALQAKLAELESGEDEE